jgi:methionine-rich copper-binding protein CopC
MNKQDWLFAAVPSLLLTVLIACAGGPGVTPQNNTGNTGNTGTQTAPTITSSTPANSAVGVAVDSSLTVTFSKAMNPASVQVTTTPEVDLGPSTWSDGDATLRLTPPASLEPGTAYTLSLEGQDATGTALTGSKTFGFTTASAADPAPACQTG